jgi:hypothetical protein
VVLEAVDPALDRLASGRAGRPWRVIRLPEPWPAARVATEAALAPNRIEMAGFLSSLPRPEVVRFLPADFRPRTGEPPGGSRGRLLAWDGREAVVEHEGDVDLVVVRTDLDGWSARVDGGHWTPTVPADGGLQSVRLEGSGTRRVRFRYWPTHFERLAAVSIGSATLAVVLAATGFSRRRRLGPTAAVDAPSALDAG